MSRDADAVYAAIDRWQGGLLIDDKTAAILREETATHSSAGTRRLSQYVLAATGGLVLLIAGGVFLDWAWPLLDKGARATVLGIVGVLVLIGGASFEGARRWRPASYLMQTSGLGLLLSGFIYSDSVWADQTLSGSLIGVLALVAPIVRPRYRATPSSGCSTGSSWQESSDWCR